MLALRYGDERTVLPVLLVYTGSNLPIFRTAMEHCNVYGIWSTFDYLLHYELVPICHLSHDDIHVFVCLYGTYDGSYCLPVKCSSPRRFASKILSK